MRESFVRKGSVVGFVVFALGLTAPGSAFADLRTGSIADPADGTGGPSADIERLSASYDQASGTVSATIRFYAPVPDLGDHMNPGLNVGFYKEPSSACGLNGETGGLLRSTTDPDAPPPTYDPNNDITSGEDVTFTVGPPKTTGTKSVSADGREITLSASAPFAQGFDWRCVEAAVLRRRDPHAFAGRLDTALLFFDGYGPPGGGGAPGSEAGTPGDDVLSGTAGADRICGLAGDDVINALAGSDTLYGDQCGATAGASSFGLVGMAAVGDGNDRLRGGEGNDKLYGSGGADTLQAGAGNDRLAGGLGKDQLVGSAGKDGLDGGAANDSLNGGSGADSLKGGKGSDRLLGGAGADSISAKDGKRDRVDCGKGRDKVKADRGDRLIGCERITR